MAKILAANDSPTKGTRLDVPNLQALFHVGQMVQGVILKLEEGTQGLKFSHLSVVR